jgi:hypothetical protein
VDSSNALERALRQIEEVATLTPEYRGNNVVASTGQLIAALLDAYPALAACDDYIRFLRAHGGAHISNRKFSLGIYGFEGYVVASLEERSLVEEGRYFLFGELLIAGAEDELFLFFDLSRSVEASAPSVFWRTLDDPAYRACCASFLLLLSRCAEGTFCES